MEYFVKEHSIVRQIWGKADTILFIFAGASAEFALNKAVDWLYFTGRLPSDPLGRLFSTVSYARQIVFASYEDAMISIQKIATIHKGVEKSRGAQIPDWAYRDVLFMLIDYSIRSYEVLERRLTISEKREVFEVFQRVGAGMALKGLPESLEEWEVMREEHLQANMIKSDFTIDLYKQYKKHLGGTRYLMLKQVQVMVVPRKVIELLGLPNRSILWPVLYSYKLSRYFRIEKWIRNLILPQDYKSEVIQLDLAT